MHQSVLKVSNANVQTVRPIQQAMDQPTGSEERQIDQMAEELADMDLQYRPVDEPAPTDYADFVAQLPGGPPLPNFEQPAPMYAFNHPEALQQWNDISIDDDDGSERDDSGIEMEEPPPNVVIQFRAVPAIPPAEGMQVVNFCILCNNTFQDVEQLHVHLIAVHQVVL